jgi:hypothetical protein
MADPVVAGLARLLMAREAVASVALSHEESCRCVVCRAADGDEAALGEALEVLDGVGGEG